MKNLKLKVIFKYQRPYKKEFLYGSLALLVVNILSVVIPLEVKNIIDQLQNGFSSDFVISKFNVINNKIKSSNDDDINNLIKLNCELKIIHNSIINYLQNKK